MLRNSSLSMRVIVTMMVLLWLWLCMLQFTGIALVEGHFLAYEEARKAIIQAEDLLTTGGRLLLNSAESKVEEKFMRSKLDELARGFRDPEQNAAGMHFFRAKSLIDRSAVYHFLQHMPKGALLHVHSTASVSSDWVVRNMSYVPGLMRCTTANGLSILSFRQHAKLHNCNTRYVLVQEERVRSISPAIYDRNFERLINLYTRVPELEYPNIETVWTRFQDMFSTLSDALQYLPVYRAYHWRMLEELYTDNIMYAELRLNFKEVYDISGRTFPTERTIKELIDVIEQFRRTHPDFMGVKVIYSPHRDVEHNNMHKNMDEFKRWHALYPDFVIGFDMVGQEDKGKPLYAFIEALIDLPRTARFFFHAGETNWYGASTDSNLLDAMLLNTTRIGHGYALMKHPLLWQSVKSRDIAVEVSPISNQVLHLVSDMRNHPGAFFMSQNIPMVICNDDPGFWDARALSYDYYYAIMALAPNHAGLRTLKQLVWNTIRYSALAASEKRTAYNILERQWQHFMDDVIQGYVI